jgi:ketosteroid isomerase-like protein
MPGHHWRKAIATTGCVSVAVLALATSDPVHAQSTIADSGEATHVASNVSEAQSSGDDMTDLIQLTREWLDMVAMGPADAWTGRVADDVLIRLPYAPPGVESELRGFKHARETLSHHWKTKKSFAWRDVVIRKTEDPELVVTTARSEVVLMNGQPYANNYIMLTRIRDGKIVEHVEYFNPLPIMEMLKR